MKIILYIFIYTLLSDLLLAKDDYLSISNLKVVKRNKPSCDRLGNIYDSCQWMLKFTINNKTNRDLISFCSVIKVNEKKYKLCSGKNSKQYRTKAKDSKLILSNLSEMIGFDNNQPRPTVRIESISGKYSKDN